MIQQSYAESIHKNQPKKINQNPLNSQPMIEVLLQLYYFIVGAAALPVRLLLRSNFGERSITPSAWFTSLALHIWYVYYYFLLAIEGGGLIIYFFNEELLRSLSNVHIILVIALFVVNGFSIYLFEIFYRRSKSHFKDVLQNIKDGEVLDSSFYRGDGRYYRHYLGREIKTIVGQFKVNEEFLRMLVEPRKVFFIGLFITLFSILAALPFIFWINSVYAKIFALFVFSFSATGIIISLSSFCLFLEEFGLRLRRRAAALDMIDSEKDIQKILEEKEKILDSFQGEKNTLTNDEEEKKIPVVKINS